MVDSLLTGEQRSLASKLDPPSVRRLTYFHLRHLASRHHISVRAVLTALDRHPLLDEVECGIAVFRHIANVHTGRERTLRLWQSSRPSWGHVLANRRATRQGFDAAPEVFDTGSNQETVVRHERLLLRVHRPQNTPKWPVEPLSAACAYTPVDVVTEGRYLVAIWHWPNPHR